MKGSRILKNVIILVLAPILAVGLLFLTNNFSDMTASVLDIVEIEKIKTEQWDLAYKSENEIFEVFGSEKVQKQNNVSFEIIYNPEKIVLDNESASGYNYTITRDDIGFMEVMLEDIPGLDYKQGWFQISYTGLESQILLGEAWLLDNEGEKEKLKIGNLNKIEEHSILP